MNITYCYYHYYRKNVPLKLRIAQVTKTLLFSQAQVCNMRFNYASTAHPVRL